MELKAVMMETGDALSALENGTMRHLRQNWKCWLKP
jgi:hypothetical protein